MATRWVRLEGEDAQVSVGGGEEGDPRGSGPRPATATALGRLLAHLDRLTAGQDADAVGLALGGLGLRITVAGSELVGHLPPMSVDGAYLGVTFAAKVGPDRRVDGASLTTHWSNTLSDGAAARVIDEATGGMLGASPPSMPRV